jgi:hypothetical protein
MEALSSSVSSFPSTWINCFYVNATSTIQVIRIANIEDWYFERVVLPGTHLVFKAPQEAFLDIYDSVMATGVLSDRLPCQVLACSEQEANLFLQRGEATLVG